MCWGRRLDTMSAEMLYEELSGTVIGAAMEVHKLLGSGFLESVYERALASELTGRQIPFERQVPITVMYKQTQVGEYRADSLVDGKIILEIKATTALIAEHYAQALHYLTATGRRLALLLNFGTRSLQLKRIIRWLFFNPWNPWNPWRYCLLAQFALKAAVRY
jgi:GxxExxY protein